MKWQIGLTKSEGYRTNCTFLIFNCCRAFDMEVICTVDKLPQAISSQLSHYQNMSSYRCPLPCKSHQATCCGKLSISLLCCCSLIIKILILTRCIQAFYFGNVSVGIIECVCTPFLLLIKNKIQRDILQRLLCPDQNSWMSLSHFKQVSWLIMGSKRKSAWVNICLLPYVDPEGAL